MHIFISEFLIENITYKYIDMINCKAMTNKTIIQIIN